MSSLSDADRFETLSVSFPRPFVLHIQFNRPQKLNTMTTKMWKEMIECFDMASEDKDVRVIVFSGKGRMFCAGLDLKGMFMPIDQTKDVARKGFDCYKGVERAQAPIIAIEKCMKPVIAAVHGACVGGGVDTITACDIRMCSKDAYFCVKEVDVGFAADMGTLQRLPKVIGSDSLVRELCYTARKMKAEEALSCGLVSQVYQSREELMENSIKLAEEIARKSPVAIQGSKHNLNYSKNHSIPEGLEYMKAWVTAMNQTEDIKKCAQAFLQKKSPADIEFAKL